MGDHPALYKKRIGMVVVGGGLGEEGSGRVEGF
jgi:hypothetical protein